MSSSTPVDEIIRSSRRTISLIVHPDGKLTVRAPLRMSGRQIQEFIEKHQAWIRKKQAQARANPPPPKKVYRPGETFLFQGKAYPLTIVPHQRPALIFKPDGFSLASTSRQKAKETFIRWYRIRARELISERVMRLAAQNRFSYEKIRISSARTRWGSCNGAGTLSFTWRLVLAPPEVVDYVVIHELVHTKIRDHSSKFWQQVAKIMPDYKREVAWLKKNGRFLTLDGNQ